MRSHPLKSRPRIAFVDPCSAKGYDRATFEIGGLGGTEATILRVSAALRERFHVTQYQSGRLERSTSWAGDLQPLQAAFVSLEAAVIVVINRWKIALKLRKQHPETSIFLWLHVYPGRHNRKMGAALKAADITVVCVSKTHASALTEFLKPSDLPAITSIYNPLANDLRPDDTPREIDRLLFASSPHKGLAEVFGQFKALRRTFPKLTLAVADPGYLRWDIGPVPDGVVFLGSLCHQSLIQQMRRALCLFYPQTTFAETFGLVLAEANAVGTPALVHKGLGANDEILNGAGQQIDGNSSAEIFTTVTEWRRSSPIVGANPCFGLAEVAAAWTDLLSQSGGCSRSNEIKPPQMRVA